MCAAVAVCDNEDESMQLVMFVKCELALKSVLDKPHVDVVFNKPVKTTIA